MDMEGRIQCDYCVVEAGMIGCAAAKHLQVINPLSKVVLVGQREPKVIHSLKRGHTGRSSFSQLIPLMAMFALKVLL